MDDGHRRMGQGIVIGASVSGLLAARAMAEHFQQVRVIERDLLPQDGEPRKGVPQGRHAHVLLARGRELLEDFFPGLTQELVAQGAVVCDLTETGRWFSGGTYSRNFSSGLLAVQVSRPLLERTIYARVCALPNVTFLEDCDAVGLAATSGVGDGGVRITGVRVVNRTPAAAGEETLDADLVVDAGGRGSRGLAWLESLGFARPAEEHIKMNLSYTTRVFRRLAGDAQGHSPVVIIPSGKDRRGGAMLAVEGSRWIVTLSGLLGEAAPADLAGFIDYARTLGAPDIYHVVKAAEPLGEASQYKYPSSQRRRYEKLADFPEGLLVCGDAMCSFNPIYGQGITTAASEAAVLDECLRAGLAGIAPRFFRRVSRLLDSPWAIAAGNDLTFPEVEGTRVPAMRLTNFYLTRFNRASQADPVLAAAFQKVTNLIDSPAHLFRPNLLLRVLWGNLNLFVRRPIRDLEGSGRS